MHTTYYILRNFIKWINKCANVVDTTSAILYMNMFSFIFFVAVVVVVFFFSFFLFLSYFGFIQIYCAHFVAVHHVNDTPDSETASANGINNENLYLLIFKIISLLCIIITSHVLLTVQRKQFFSSNA